MIHLIQLLCPQRHTICAMAYDDKLTTEVQTIAEIRNLMKSLGVNPYCGICGSHNLKFEDHPTGDQSLAQAMPKLKQTEAANLLTRAVLDACGETHDEKLRRSRQN